MRHFRTVFLVSCLLPAVAFSQRFDKDHTTIAFPHAATIKLAAITNVRTSQSWDLAGRRLAEVHYPQAVTPKAKLNDESPSVYAVFEVTYLSNPKAEMTAVEFRCIDGSKEINVCSDPTLLTKSTIMEYAVPLDAIADGGKAAFTLMLAAGEPEVVGSYTRTAKGVVQKGFAFGPRVVAGDDGDIVFFEKPYKSMDAPLESLNEDVALVGLDASGARIWNLGWAPSHRPLLRSVPFAESTSNIKTLRLLSRPFHRISIEGIPTSPID